MMALNRKADPVEKASEILLMEINSVRDLKKYNLTLAEYEAALEIMRIFSSHKHKAECMMDGVAEFFRKCGFNVVLEDVNYVITY